MNFDRLVEQKILEAIASGEFDNLPGRGEPLDLSSYFNAPEDLRASYSILKNAGCMPEEVELLEEIGAIKQELDRCSSEEEMVGLRQ